MSATSTEPAAVYIGIDLGTTNCALAWAAGRAPVKVFEIPQVVAPGEIGRAATLPSFLYFPPHESSPADTGLVGTFARDEGALVPTRQVSSAKSWLSNASVDRTAAILPWGSDGGPRVSPVAASARLLSHLRDAWNEAHARTDDGRRLEKQAVVLTVPASFDEEARELTVEAARAAGLERLTLLEEPLAALYAWIAAHKRDVSKQLAGGALVLVCDVGGGTTDFSLIRARREDGDLQFERIAIGEHLLLGGDNLDLALAALVERKLAGPGERLTIVQRQTLRRKCAAAKEVLLSADPPPAVRITLLGAGRGVVSGGLSAELTRDEVLRTLEDGYLPLTSAADVPSRDRRVALRELGLPYESEPAITRHLAAFLARSGTAAGVPGLARPDLVLFNGGFFAPAAARARVLDVLASWFGDRPRELQNARPEAAVAIGAAVYARLRSDPAANRRLLIRAGAARSYYIGLGAPDGGGEGIAAMCVVPRGTEEGTAFALDRELSTITNQPAAFTLYSAADRDDPAGALVTLAADTVHRHAPLVTVLRYGKRSRRVPLAVTLRAAYTETGTLELWCESRTTDHRWRLAFGLRQFEGDAPESDDAAGSGDEGDRVVVSDAAVAAASELIRGVFAADGAVPPGALTGDLENALGHGKHSWPLPAIRRLADVLLEHAAGRRRSPDHEARWLNLVGFCVRPGFGSRLDEWRVSELRKVYAAGLAFPRDVQGQVEWLVLWQRVAAGFSPGHQRELAQRVIGQLGIGQRKPPRVNPQIEREGWRLLASLERLDAAQRTSLGSALVERVRREPRSQAWLWAMGRFGARRPFYGPLSSVVPPSAAERWIAALLDLKHSSPDVAAALVQVGARTDDPARDVSDAVRDRIVERLSADYADEARTVSSAAQSTSAADATRVFGESLPEGLQLSRP